MVGIGTVDRRGPVGADRPGGPPVVDGLCARGCESGAGAEPVVTAYGRAP